MSTATESAVAPVAIASLTTQIGEMSVAVTESGLRGVRWCTAAEYAEEFGQVAQDRRLTDPVVTELAEYFAGSRRRFTIGIEWSTVSVTQRRVLENLAETVAFGTSISYGELAERSGTGVPARTVGSIMSANPVPIVVPCHRVLAVNGLGGFSGGQRPDDDGAPARGLSRYGLETKRWLLTFEAVLQPTLGWDPGAPLSYT
jgi:methylated-DNA-[protein]-cysteine S-methyltransferase